MKTMAVVVLVVVLILLGCVALYLPQISPSLASVKDPTLKMGVHRAVLKTIIQLAMYPLVLLWTAWLAWKQYRSAS
jgi:hypothetical protein